jgi:hypothetical protein
VRRFQLDAGAFAFGFDLALQGIGFCLGGIQLGTGRSQLGGIAGVAAERYAQGEAHRGFTGAPAAARSRVSAHAQLHRVTPVCLGQCQSHLRAAHLGLRASRPG